MPACCHCDRKYVLRGSAPPPVEAKAPTEAAPFDLATERRQCASPVSALDVPLYVSLTPPVHATSSRVYICHRSLAAGSPLSCLRSFVLAVDTAHHGTDAIALQASKGSGHGAIQAGARAARGQVRGAASATSARRRGALASHLEGTHHGRLA